MIIFKDVYCPGNIRYETHDTLRARNDVTETIKCDC